MASTSVNVAVLGAGFMGTTILEGLLRYHTQSGGGNQHTFGACVRSESSFQRLKRDLSAFQPKLDLGHGAEDTTRIAAAADIIPLGVAPGDLNALLETPGLRKALRGKIIVSLLAGVSYQQLITSLGAEEEWKLARVIPSLGARIGRSVTLIAETERIKPGTLHIDAVERLFARVGSVRYVPESLMTEATALGAVSHALSIIAVDTLSDAGASDGLPRATAAAITQQCLASASELMLAGMTPAEMKNAMAIPTGSTINAVLDLERNARPAIADSARAATAYTRRMS